MWADDFDDKNNCGSMLQLPVHLTSPIQWALTTMGRIPSTTTMLQGHQKEPECLIKIRWIFGERPKFPRGFYIQRTQRTNEILAMGKWISDRLLAHLYVTHGNLEQIGLVYFCGQIICISMCTFFVNESATQLVGEFPKSQLPGRTITWLVYRPVNCLMYSKP